MSIDTSRPVNMILQNGEVLRYGSLRELGMCLHVQSHLLHKVAVSGHYIDPAGGLFCKVVYADGLPPEPGKKQEKPAKPRKEKQPVHNAVAVVVTFLDGEERRYDSLGECSRDTCVDRDMLTRLMRTGKPHGIHGLVVRRA